MTTQEKCEAIRRELKTKGYSSRKVGVRHEYAGYSAVIRVTIKDLSIDRQEIEAIANKQSEVDRDKRTGEILAGGNTYVFVEYDWKLTAAS